MRHWRPKDASALNKLFKKLAKIDIIIKHLNGRVVELVYTHALGACSARIESSSLSPPTKKILITKGGLNFFEGGENENSQVRLFSLVKKVSIQSIDCLELPKQNSDH